MSDTKDISNIKRTNIITGYIHAHDLTNSGSETWQVDAVFGNNIYSGNNPDVTYRVDGNKLVGWSQNYWGITSTFLRTEL